MAFGLPTGNWRFGHPWLNWSPLMDAVVAKRKEPRIEVFAQAAVKGKDVHIMGVRNLSAGGFTWRERPSNTPR